MISSSARTAIRSSMFLLLMLGVMGCSSLPASTPEAIGLAATRIELNAVAAQTALNNATDNGLFSQKQLEAALKKLEAVDTSNLSATDQTSFADASRLLKNAQSGLTLSKTVLETGDQVRARLDSTASALRELQGILAEKVEQEDIVNNITDRLQMAVSKE
jgi:hypothetical protein